MALGKKKLLAAFLEKDNVKLLAFEVSGSNVSRIFGGQASFGDEALRDAFISDPVKFSAQVKMILSQRAPLTEIAEGVLFIHPDKTFIKPLSSEDSVDAFVRSLPFFKEELVILAPETAKNQEGKGSQINFVAFEKKLVEDFERPFLESGKKILAVNSAVPFLVKKFKQAGRYILILPFEKDVTVVACQDGVVLDLATFAKDVWVGRLSEFRMGKGFSDITNVFVVSNLEQGASDKLRNEQQLNVTELSGGDVYDLAMSTYLSGGEKGGKNFSMPKFAMPKIPGLKWVFLLLAGLVGFALVYFILKNVFGVNLPKPIGGTKPTPTPVKVATPAPTPSAKPEDFKVSVLNGTTVAGEAAAFGETLSALGFEVIETANATTSGFVATRLLTVPEVPQSIIDQLKSTILETYESVSEEPLSSGSAQIQVIIGVKK